MKKWFFLFAILSGSLVGCQQDDDEDNSPTPAPTTPITPTPGPQMDSIYVEPEQQEAFIGLISRTTCGLCGQFGHPNFDEVLRTQPNVNGVSFHYSSSDDLATPEGFEFSQFMGLRGTPSYTENLSNFGSSVQNWRDAITNAQALSLQAQIGMSAQFTAERSARLHVDVSFVQSITAPVQLAIYMTENNLVGGQADYGASPSFVEDYIHNHTLRGSVTGLWGESLVSAPQAGQMVQRSYDVTLPSNTNPLHVWYVAVLYEVNGAGEPVRVINSQTLKR